MTPQLALRVAVIGSFALVLFAIIFFRLWVLQVLSGTRYVQQASANFIREVPVPAPRGEVLDSAGQVMVSSVRVPVVAIAPSDLPVKVTAANMLAQPAADYALYDRLAKVLSMSTTAGSCTVDFYKGGGKVTTQRVRLAPIPCLVAQGVGQSSYANVTIKTDVPDDVRAYLLERQPQFEGIVVAQTALRQYPFGDTAAQLFGTVGPVTYAEHHSKPFSSLSPTAIVGQAGLEREYNQYLQGVDGSDKVTVNASGQVEGSKAGRAAIPGANLKLSINLGLQKVGQQALETSIADNAPGSGGAFVALDPQSGQVLAMGSAPTFNPSVFTKPVSTSTYDQLTNPAANYPLLNRATQSAGPTGSTFKVITALAALESGNWLLDQTFDDTGQYCTSGLCRHNAGHAAYGVVNLIDAIRVSDDIFFYNLGARTNVSNPLATPQGGALQSWARQLGIGRNTGIDLPYGTDGTLPTPAWREGINKAEAACDRKRHLPGGGCGLAIYPFEPWTIGDNENMAVGQGDVQVSPLQLAVAYAALANGGTVVTPHVGEDIQSPDGTILQKISPAPVRHLPINPTYLGAILTGLREAASQPSGTSYDVMGNFPQQVYGKTGTAQYVNNGVEQDTAWYACFVPASATSKPIVVVVRVEKGGFGDVAAAPVARQILSQWFYGKPGPFVKGSSPTL